MDVLKKLQEARKKLRGEVTVKKLQFQNVIEVKEFRTAKDLLKLLLGSKEFYGLLLHGEGGLGKTVLVLSELEKELGFKGKKWEYFSGYTTPLSLYLFLYENKDKEVLVLDDVEGLFSNKTSISLLKGALWSAGGDRYVGYQTTRQMRGVPKLFKFSAKLVIMANDVPLNSKSLSMGALLSRVIAYNVGFSLKQKLLICKEFIERDNKLDDTQKLEVLRLLEKYSTHLEVFNFRTLRKIVGFVLHDPDQAENLLVEVLGNG